MVIIAQKKLKNVNLVLKNILVCDIIFLFTDIFLLFMTIVRMLTVIC